MADRDPTTGELQVQLVAMRGLLETIAKTMLTKDLFEAYKEQSNERIRRVEDDQKEWAKVSTAAHVELDKDSKARHAESDALIAKNKTETETALRELRKEFSDYQKTADSDRKTRFNGLLFGAFSAVLAVILKFFVPGG